MMVRHAKRSVCWVFAAVWFVGCSARLNGEPGAPIPAPDGLVATDAGVNDAAGAPIDAAAVPKLPQTLDEAGLVSAALDRTADPCSDFYRYACGGWLDTFQLPADRSSYALAFSGLDERNEALMRQLVEQVTAKPGGDAAKQAIAAYYGSCLDLGAIETAGTAAIQPLMQEIAAIREVSQITPVLAKLQLYLTGAVFGHWPGSDLQDPTQQILMLYQGGLGLDNAREFYLDDSSDGKALLDFYRGHVQSMLQLAGLSTKDAGQAARDVLALETELAKISKSAEELNDIDGTYNRIDRQGLKQLVPNIDWDAYFMLQGAPQLTAISIDGEGFFSGFNQLLASQPLRVWRSYFSYHLVATMATYLPKVFRDQSFLLEAQLYGAAEERERWKICLEETQLGMPNFTGRLFVEQRFTPEARARARTVLDRVTAAFGEAMDSADWLDAKTLAMAKKKLAAMGALIGFPDKWLNYDYAFDAKNYASSELALREAIVRDQNLPLVGKPVDKTIFDFPVEWVNAYNDLSLNRMIFPAGILLPPFFSQDNVDAVNYGAIGSVMGHELTHGFDDQGSQLDENGGLVNWWSDATFSAFEQKTACVADHYGTYEWVPGVPINGSLVLGEAVADLGGIKLAYRAFRKLRAEKPPLTVEGATEAQMFFLAAAQIECSTATEETLQFLSEYGVHPPGWARVNGAMRNFKPFAEAFSCARGTPLNPAERCEVW